MDGEECCNGRSRHSANAPRSRRLTLSAAAHALRGARMRCHSRRPCCSGSRVSCRTARVQQWTALGTVSPKAYKQAQIRRTTGWANATKVLKVCLSASALRTDPDAKVQPHSFSSPCTAPDTDRASRSQRSACVNGWVFNRGLSKTRRRRRRRRGCLCAEKSARTELSPQSREKLEGQLVDARAAYSVQQRL